MVDRRQAQTAPRHAAAACAKGLAPRLSARAANVPQTMPARKGMVSPANRCQGTVYRIDDAIDIVRCCNQGGAEQ